MKTLSGKQRRMGYTLVELLLALTITAIIGGAVASVLAGVSQGTQSRFDTRHRNAFADVVCGRIAGRIREGGMVLSAGEHHLVLWLGDERGNSLPDLSELRRIEFDSGTRQIRTYEAPADLAQEQDVTYALATDFGAATAALRGTARFVGQTVATNVDDWRVCVPSDPASARLIASVMTFTDTEGTHSVRSATALRNERPIPD